MPIVTLERQMSSNLVRYLNFTTIICVWAQPEESRISLMSGYCWWNSVLEVLHWQELSEGFGSNYNRLRIGEKVEWMVCHSDCKYLHFLSQSDEDPYHHLHQKKSGCTILANLPAKLCLQPIVYCITTVVLHYLALQHQCCIVTCVALPKHCL